MHFQGHNLYHTQPAGPQLTFKDQGWHPPQTIFMPQKRMYVLPCPLYSSHGDRLQLCYNILQYIAIIGDGLHCGPVFQSTEIIRNQAPESYQQCQEPPGNLGAISIQNVCVFRHSIAAPTARSLVQDPSVRARSQEDLQKLNKSSSWSQYVATGANRWLQELGCG